jgi:hypothetical protein
VKGRKHYVNLLAGDDLEVWILRRTTSDDGTEGAWVCTVPADEDAGDCPGEAEWVELAQIRTEEAGPIDASATAGQLAVELDHATRRIQGLEREVERLAGWLRKIDGGDNPCLDESKLRQWAYNAIVLNNEPNQEKN